jgi:hypothetical protein
MSSLPAESGGDGEDHGSEVDSVYIDGRLRQDNGSGEDENANPTRVTEILQAAREAGEDITTETRNGTRFRGYEKLKQVEPDEQSLDEASELALGSGDRPESPAGSFSTPDDSPSIQVSSWYRTELS